MALIAVHAVIDISSHVRVVEIGGVAAAMAIRALKNGVVIRIGVAGRADAVGATMIHGPPRVVKSRSRPGAGGVASGTSCRKHGRRGSVDWIRRREVIRFMAAVAIGRQRRVVVIYMAARAGHLRVETSQGKRGCVVIEGAIRPQRRVVTYLTRRRESHLNMVDGRRRVVVVVQVARDARRIRARQAVIVVDVAIRADSRRRGVRIRQGKSGRGMIELTVRPGHGVVASLTSRGKR